MTPPIRPSEVTTFLRCPRLWYLKDVEGWEPVPEAWTPERFMGTAIHAGLAAYWEGSDPHTQLKGTFAVNWPENAPSEYSEDGLATHALKVLDKVLEYIVKDTFMSQAQPLMVEQPLGEDGHTTPDLVTRESIGLVVTDWKYHHHVDPDRVRHRLGGAERTWQFLHYCWAVEEHLKEPVKLFRKVVIVGGPRIMVREATFQPTPERLEYWLRSARQVWEDMRAMRAGERVAWQNANGCLMYGSKYPCAFYESCWTCHGDETKMRQFLVKK